MSKRRTSAWKIRKAEPLVKGGQGRSDQDVKDSSIVGGIALVVVVAFVVWRIAVALIRIWAQ